MKKKSKFVKVFWRDTSGIGNTHAITSWFTKEQLLEKARNFYDLHYVSVGEIIENNKDYIVLAATNDGDIDKKEILYSDATMIPKSVIIRIESLKETTND